MTTSPRPPTGSSTDTAHLRTAVALAREASAEGSLPFGAVLVDADGAVLAIGRNGTAGGDATAHAELDAIRAVAPADRPRLAGATCYASGEPCPMCAAALVWAGVARIVFAAATADFAPLLPAGPTFALPCADVVASSSEPVTVAGPLLGAEGLDPFRAPRGDGVSEPCRPPRTARSPRSPRP